MAQLQVLLFTDQVSSTAATSVRTLAENLRVGKEQKELTAAAVQRCGGTVQRDTGDGAMAIFTSCRDAVKCGGSIQQSVRERNESVAEPTLRFELHIGIDFGDVAVLESGDIRAHAANLAARVGSKSPAGEVYFTEKVKDELHPREAEVEKLGPVALKGVKGKPILWKLVRWTGETAPVVNPFFWRARVIDVNDIFDREHETRQVMAYLRGRQSVQIVGPKRIGKSSLLRRVEVEAPQWSNAAVVAQLDISDPVCFTLRGLLGSAGVQLGCSPAPDSLLAFSNFMNSLVAKGAHPVLCMDDIDGLFRRKEEFTDRFFMTLRHCGNLGVSIAVTSLKRLSDFAEPGDYTSPLYNIFPILKLGPFTATAASKFVTEYRPGVPAFTTEEKTAILDFAKGHPLALQVACYWMLEARQRGESPAVGIQEAEEQMRGAIRSW